mgnify:CR=1 FL=1
MKFVHAHSTQRPQNAIINSTISQRIMIVSSYNAWLSLISVHIIKSQPLYSQQKGCLLKMNN